MHSPIIKWFRLSVCTTILKRKVFQSTFRNKFCLSVCTTILKKNSWPLFLSTDTFYQCVIYINGFVSTSSIMESFFFKFVFELLAENRKIFKRIARSEYWSKCIVLHINRFVLTSSTKWWKAFFKFLNNFRINDNFLNNSGVKLK